MKRKSFFGMLLLCLALQFVVSSCYYEPYHSRREYRDHRRHDRWEHHHRGYDHRY